MFQLTVVIAGNGNKTNKKYNLQAVDYASAVTGKDAILAGLALVSDGVIQKTTLSEITPIASNYAASGVQVENLASLAIRTVADKPATATIPAPVDGLFLGASGDASNIVDVADADLQTYFTALSAHTYVSDGEVPNVLNGGKRIHKKSSKG